MKFLRRLAVAALLAVAAPALAQTPQSVQNTINNNDWVTPGKQITGPVMKDILDQMIQLFSAWVPANFLTANAPVFTGLPTFQGCTGYLFGNDTSPATCYASIPGASLTIGVTPGAVPLAGGDQLIVFQNGLPRVTTVSAFGTAFGLTLPTVDLKFSQGLYQGLTCITLGACTAATNSGGFVQWADGHWTAVAPNVAPISDLGLRDDPVSTNLLLWSRDLTNAAWTNTNLSSAHTAAGADGAANAATTLTATGSNGTSCQGVTSAGGGGGGATGEHTGSILIRRRAGTGEVDISMESRPGHAIGTFWKPITLTSAYQRVFITYDTTPNPVLCTRVTTIGDAVDVDLTQIEARVWATSPMATTTVAVTRVVDNLALTNAANTLLNSGAASVITSMNGAAAGNFRHQTGFSSFGGATAFAYPWQYASGFSFWTDGSEGAGAQPYTLCGLLSNIDQQQSMALPVVFGFGWDATGFSQSCDGGTSTYGTASVPAAQTYYVGGAASGPTAYISELKLYNFRLSQTVIQSLTLAGNPAAITDTIPSSGAWNNYSQATGFSAVVGGTSIPFTGGPTQNSYGFESGLHQSGITGNIQFGQVGNMIRFNQFANNCGVDDDCQLGNYGGSERVELDGAVGATGDAQWAGSTDAWFSFSRCIEPGAPSTANWLFGFQVHHLFNPAGGASPPFALNTKIGEYNQVLYVSDGNQANTVPFEWPTARGKWEKFVLQLNFDPTGAVGKIHIWLNGVQVVNFDGITGETPVSGTQGYYAKFGIYRGSAAEYAAIRYANFTYSSSSLAAKIASPDAIPAGYGTTCQ